MEEKKITELRNKITDFTRFSMILLTLGVFLGAGSYVPFEGKTDYDRIFLGLSAIVLIGVSFLFNRLVVKLKEQLDNE
jgi:hypothetical protein